MAANGLASNKTCIDLTLTFSACIHSTQGTVPAGVLVARSYTKQTSLPSTNVFLLCTPVTIWAKRRVVCMYSWALSNLSMGPVNDRCSSRYRELASYSFFDQ